MTVSEQIIQVLTYLGEKFGIAIDWTSENVIPYITTLCAKLISYEIWTSVAWIGIMAIVAIIAIIYLRAHREGIRDFMSEDELCVFLTIIAILGIFGTVIGVVGTQVFDIIKCKTFPEMYIFEYIQDMIEAAK